MKPFVKVRQMVIREGWHGAGRKCSVFGTVFVQQEWAVVLFDDEEDPTTFKMAGLRDV